MTVIQQIKEASPEQLAKLLLEISVDGMERIDRVICRSCEHKIVAHEGKAVGCSLSDCVVSDEVAIRKWLESEDKI